MRDCTLLDLANEQEDLFPGDGCAKLPDEQVFSLFYTHIPVEI